MTNRNALVTGASEGIGRAFAKALAAEGYKLTLVARNQTRLDELAQELGDGHSVLAADLSTAEGIAKVSHKFTETHYDLLFNNAGFGHYGSFPETDLKIYQNMMRLNMDALVALSHAYLNHALPGDSLINTSSTLAFLPMPANGVYAATKAFVTSFSESLWYEQKKRGIYVMNLCPGITISQFHTRAGGVKENYPEQLAQTAEQVVATALKALKKRKSPTVISGVQNSSFAALTRFIPRKGTIAIMGQAKM